MTKYFNNQLGLQLLLFAFFLLNNHLSIVHADLISNIAFTQQVELDDNDVTHTHTVQNSSTNSLPFDAEIDLDSPHIPDPNGNLVPLITGRVHYDYIETGSLVDLKINDVYAVVGGDNSFTESDGTVPSSFYANQPLELTIHMHSSGIPQNGSSGVTTVGFNLIGGNQSLNLIDTSSSGTSPSADIQDSVYLDADTFYYFTENTTAGLDGPGINGNSLFDLELVAVPEARTFFILGVAVLWLLVKRSRASELLRLST